MKTAVPGLLLVFLAASLTAIETLQSAYRNVSIEVCELMSDNYYLSQEPRALRFHKLCLEAAKNQTFLIAKSRNIQRINARLSALRTSHLSLYDPNENQQMWENLSLDTGIRAHRIDDQLVISRILPASPAARAGIRAGDALLTINGIDVTSEGEGQTGSGLFRLRRGHEEVTFEIQPEKITEDMRPTLTELEKAVALLRIPSFLPQYFALQDWQALNAKLSHYRGLIIDLRDNAGGSFPAMLRALSSFRCERPFVGSLYHTRGQSEKTTLPLEDNLDAENQIEQLEKADWLELRAYSTYGCYSGPVVVLIDSGTSSTAEIFAQAFAPRARSEILGQTSSGEVVMARWFPVDSLGENYSLSIPIAGFVMADGSQIEGVGVAPKKTLFYDLAKALRGEDSWLDDALKELHHLTHESFRE